MVKKTVVNNILSTKRKRFYFPDEIVSVPFGHENLKEIDNFKQEKGKSENREIVLGRKRSFIYHGKKALKNTPRLYLYHQILMSSPKIFNINQKNDFKKQNRTLLK